MLRWKQLGIFMKQYTGAANLTYLKHLSCTKKWVLGRFAYHSLQPSNVQLAKIARRAD